MPPQFGPPVRPPGIDLRPALNAIPPSALRDYFAATALPAALDNFEDVGDYFIELAAALAYRIADAMLLERAKAVAK